MGKATFGTISHGTMRSCDLIEAFLSALRDLDDSDPENIDEARALEIADREGWLNDEGQIAASEVVTELSDKLNEFAPSYGYFGAHPGDGSDYGFWLSEDWQERAKDDGVEFGDELPEVAPESGMFCVVSDHGNATFYYRDSKGEWNQEWAVV